MCKSCKKLIGKARYNNNTEKIKETNKEWREANPEAMQAARIG